MVKPAFTWQECKFKRTHLSTVLYNTWFDPNLIYRLQHVVWMSRPGAGGSPGRVWYSTVQVEHQLSSFIQRNAQISERRSHSLLGAGRCQLIEILQPLLNKLPWTSIFCPSTVEYKWRHKVKVTEKPSTTSLKRKMKKKLKKFDGKDWFSVVYWVVVYS